MYVQDHLANPKHLYHEKGMLNTEGIARNNEALEADYAWLNTVLRSRFSGDSSENFSVNADWDFLSIPPPDLSAAQGPYAAFVQFFELAPTERLLLLLALAPNHRPQALSYLHDIAISAFNVVQTRINGLVPKRIPVFFPDLSTWLFIAAGDNTNFEAEIFQNNYRYGILFREQIILLKESRSEDMPGINRFQLLEIAGEYVDFLLCGHDPRPDFGRDFPATLLTTALTWKHLVVHPNTQREIDEIMKWTAHGKNVLAKSKKTLKGTYPVLFYGPPGTGKSFTAALIGKEFGKQVFRVDLSQIVSKWVGETEKNLARLFDRAQGKDWILFFDEADSLFGQRTGISDSKDKWANLEMSYLLQRIEEFDGLCILATNFKDNIDGAMKRRFRISTHFARPTEAERKRIWELAGPTGYQMPADINYDALAKFDLTGANIANVVFHCCVAAEARGESQMNSADMSYFINLEFSKESRTP